MATATHAQETKVTGKKATATKAPAKPVKKASAKAAAAKPAPKAPRKAKAKAPAAPVRPEVRFTICNRPSSGVILFAYTQAALDLLGMLEGVAVPARKITQVMGATALRYHLDKQTFAKNDSGDIVLTPAGVAFFAERNTKAAPDHIEAFKRMMIEGVEDGVINKNAQQVVELKA